MRKPLVRRAPLERRIHNLERSLVQVTLERDEALLQLAAAESMAELRTLQLQRRAPATRKQPGELPAGARRRSDPAPSEREVAR